MKPRISVELTREERAELEGMIRSGAASARAQSKARILLLTDQSQGERRTNQSIARSLSCSGVHVGRVRRRFVEEGLKAALYDKPRPGGVPKITGEIEAQLTVLACSDPPEGRKRWTLHLLADQMVALGYVESISHVAVLKRLKKTSSSRGG